MVQRNLFLKFIIFWYWYQWKEVECFFLQISMKVSVFFQKGKVSFPQALIKVSIYNYQQQKYKRKQKAQFWQLMFTWSLWYVLIMPLFELIIIINICFLSEKLQFFFYNAIITKWNIWTINIFFGNTKGLFGISVFFFFEDIWYKCLNNSFQYLNFKNYYLNICTEQVFSIFKKDVNGSNIPFCYYSIIKKKL